MPRLKEGSDAYKIAVAILEQDQYKKIERSLHVNKSRILAEGDVNQLQVIEDIDDDINECRARIAELELDVFLTRRDIEKKKAKQYSTTKKKAN